MKWKKDEAKRRPGPRPLDKSGPESPTNSVTAENEENVKCSNSTTDDKVCVANKNSCESVLEKPESKTFKTENGICVQRETDKFHT